MNIDSLVAFYLNSRDLKERLGFTINNVHTNFTNDELESCHNYIQWSFPLKEISQFNPSAPVLDQDTIEVFRDLSVIQDNVSLAVGRMIRFYFLDGRGLDTWVTSNNHNFLRITRILKFLRILGFHPLADNFWYYIENIVLSSPEYCAIIGEETIKYWKEANETKPD